MRCSACGNYMHKHHKRVIEHDDGTAEICDCQKCNADVAQVEQATEITQEMRIPKNVSSADASASLAVSPPPHPYPFDRRIFSIAEEPPGTNPYLPWQSTYCIECNNQIWAKNQKTIDEGTAMCEGCTMILLQQMTDLRVQRENHAAMKPHNPFSSSEE